MSADDKQPYTPNEQAVIDLIDDAPIHRWPNGDVSLYDPAELFMQIRDSDWLDSVRAEARAEVELAARLMQQAGRRAAKAEAERDALAAVIEKVREAANKQADLADHWRGFQYTEGRNTAGALVLEALDTAPSNALDERDARIRKQTLLDAADHVDEGRDPAYQLSFDNGEYARGHAYGFAMAKRWLRASASHPRTDDAHETEGE